MPQALIEGSTAPQTANGSNSSDHKSAIIGGVIWRAALLSQLCAGGTLQSTNWRSTMMLMASSTSNMNAPYDQPPEPKRVEANDGECASAPPPLPYSEHAGDGEFQSRGCQ